MENKTALLFACDKSVPSGQGYPSNVANRKWREDGAYGDVASTGSGPETTGRSIIASRIRRPESVRGQLTQSPKYRL